MQHKRLAFVDIETTGLGAEHRIAEIGVVTVDTDGRIDEWSTLLDPGRRIADLPSEFGGEPAYFCADRATELPRFRDIAAGIAERLDGCLLVAHNARFDYAFLKAEFERAGIAFQPPVLCSLMLSRRLFPAHDCHDLDALCARHAVDIAERHRALADARLLHRVWQALRRECGDAALDAAAGALLAEPLLLPGIDAAMIDALPPRRGVLELLGADDQVLAIARAANIRQHVKRCFRLDRHCARAAEIAPRLKRIRWQPASGPLDARLRELALRRSATASQSQAPHSILLDPTATPAATIVELTPARSGDADLFGIFASQRKATNALRKAAKAGGLCHRLLGIGGATPCACGASSRSTASDEARPCLQQRTRHLLQLAVALSPIRLQPWPFTGPIAIRERQTVHVFDRWEHLGSARTASDMLGLRAQRRNGFDPAIYALLRAALPRLSADALRVFGTQHAESGATTRVRDETGQPA